MAMGEGWQTWIRTASNNDASMFLAFVDQNDRHLVRKAVTSVRKECKSATIERIDYLIDKRHEVAFVARNNFIYVRFTTPTEKCGEMVFFARHNRTGTPSLDLGGGRLRCKLTK